MKNEYEKKIKEPYSIVLLKGRFVLRNGRKMVKRLLAASPDGADREAALFLKI